MSQMVPTVNMEIPAYKGEARIDHALYNGHIFCTHNVMTSNTSETTPTQGILPTDFAIEFMEMTIAAVEFNCVVSRTIPQKNWPRPDLKMEVRVLQRKKKCHWSLYRKQVRKRKKSANFTKFFFLLTKTVTRFIYNISSLHFLVPFGLVFSSHIQHEFVIPAHFKNFRTEGWMPHPKQ